MTDLKIPLALGISSIRRERAQQLRDRAGLNIRNTQLRQKQHRDQHHPNEQIALSDRVWVHNGGNPTGHGKRLYTLNLKAPTQRLNRSGKTLFGCPPAPVRMLNVAMIFHCMFRA